MKNQKNVVIIGTGMGGLAAGAYLARNGCRVSLFERLNQVGGYVHTFKRGGFRFEASTHQICSLVNGLYFDQTLSELGIFDKLSIRNAKYSFESILFDDNQSAGNRYLIPAGYDESLNALIAQFPKEKVVLEETFSYIRAIARETLRLKRLQRVSPFKYPVDLILGGLLKSAPQGSILKKIGIAAFPNFVKAKDKTLEQLLSHIENPAIQFLLSYYSHFALLSPSALSGLVGAAMSYLYMLEKPIYIDGGSQTIVDELLKVIKSNGGSVHYKSKVSKIIVENDRAVGIQTEDGSVHYGDAVVSNASAVTTFRSLLDNQHTFDPTFTEKITHFKAGPSIFQVYLGLPFDIREYGFTSSTTTLCNSLNLNENFKKHPFPSNLSTCTMTNYGITNPEFNSDGRTSIVLAEQDDSERWRDLPSEQYQAQKDAVQKIIVEKVQRITGIPLDRAEVCFSGTPRTMAWYSGNPYGSIVGGETTVEQSVMNRFSAKTPLPGLFIVGADSMPSGGVSACLDSGVIAGRVIAKSR